MLILVAEICTNGFHLLVGSHISIHCMIVSAVGVLWSFWAWRLESEYLL